MINATGSRIVFTDQFRANALDELLTCIGATIAHGHRGITLDFSAVSAAWPDSMVPLIATVDWLRANGHEVSLTLPKDAQLRRLYLETSWAHHIEPTKHPPPTGDALGFRVRRFTSAKEQQNVVNEFMKLVIGKLQPTKDVITALEWSINEITDNVLTHAEASAGGLVQILSVPDPGGILFCVADAGRGIFESMRSGHPALSTAEAALSEAVKQGVTRDPKVGQGNGLAGTSRVTTMSGGRFTVASDVGRYSISSEGQRVVSRGTTFHGTVVTADIQMSSDLRVEQALGFSMNILDYYDEEGSSMILSLAREVEGVGIGSRPAGAYVREKCRHMLAQEPTKVLLVDWTGTGVVSSSFADEAFGKLFIELGPLTFGARVRHRGITPVNGGLVDKAILQRSATVHGPFADET